jgi:hypothetical protein
VTDAYAKCCRRGHGTGPEQDPLPGVLGTRTVADRGPPPGPLTLTFRPGDTGTGLAGCAVGAPAAAQLAVAFGCGSASEDSGVAAV